MQTAMVACLNGEGAERCGAALRGAGYAVAGPVFTAGEVIPGLRAHRPRVLLSEAVLPGGDGVWLARAVASASLDLYPHVLLLNVPGLLMPDADALGDYGAALIDPPLTAKAVASAVDGLEARATGLPPERAARLDGLLDRLGVPDHPGREMLRNAVALAWRDRSRLNNLRDRVYPPAARPLGRKWQQAERGIRHAIDAAWRSGAMDEQQRIFGDTIDARRGRPTCGEMIAQLADILRWEGRK